MNDEARRLEESRTGRGDWKRWGPYLSASEPGAAHTPHRTPVAPAGRAYAEAGPHCCAKALAERL